MYTHTYHHYSVSRIIFQPRVLYAERRLPTHCLFPLVVLEFLPLPPSPLPVSPRSVSSSRSHPSVFYPLASFSLSILLSPFLTLRSYYLRLSSSRRINPPSHTPVLIPSYHPRRERPRLALFGVAVCVYVRVGARSSRLCVYLATERPPPLPPPLPSATDVVGVAQSKRPKWKEDEEEKPGGKSKSGTGTQG